MSIKTVERKVAIKLANGKRHVITVTSTADSTEKDILVWVRRQILRADRATAVITFTK